MKLSREEVAHVAQLARLEMSEQEMALYTEQLNTILDFVDKLNKLDTHTVPPTAHVLPLKNVLREDKVVTPLPRTEALASAPEAERGMFRVPRVID